MTDLDWMGPEPDDRNVTVRKCRRHLWGTHFPTVAVCDRTGTMEPHVECGQCGKVRDEALSKQNKNNRSRGLSIQRQVAAAAEMEHIPGNGPADARDRNFYAEIKSGPAWYSTRVEAELDNLPTDTGRVPVFIAASTPGPGNGKRRVYATMGLGDLVRLVGPHAQVSMWLPEWVAMKAEDAA